MGRKKAIKTSKDLSNLIADLMLQKKAGDISILDLTEITTVTDYFVICTAYSDIQVKAIADFVSEETRKANNKPWHSEVYTNLSWILLDYVDVVVHIFLPESRKFYNLEGLWGDAKIIRISDEE